MKSFISNFISSIDFKDTWFRIIVGGIIAAVLFVIFLTPKTDKSKISSVATKPSAPAEVSTGVEIIYSDSAKVKAKLNTPKMIRFLTDDPIMEMPNGLNVLFYDKKMKVNSKMRANYGIRYINKNLTIARGNVVVVNTKGDTMNTEELTWHEDKEKVVSDKFVKVKTKDEIILAQGFESDITFTKYTFYKIKGTIHLKGGLN